MVSLFGRGFDSLQLHHLSKCKPLTFKRLAASLCPASPVFSVFGDALGDAKRVLLNPIWQLFSYFLTQFQIIKNLKMHCCCVFTYFFHFYCHFCPLHAFTWNYKCGLFSDFVIVQENIHFYMKLHILILLQWLKRTLLCSSYFMDLYVFTWICRFWFVALMLTRT